MFQKLRSILFKQHPPKSSVEQNPMSPTMYRLILTFTLLDTLDKLQELEQLPILPDFPPEYERYTYPHPGFPDAVLHTIIIDTRGNQFFVVRQGGIAGLNEVYRGNLQETLDCPAILV